MIEYKIIDGDPDDVERSVNMLLKNGWALYGTPLLGDNGYFVQAMTRQVHMPPPDLQA